MANLVFSNLIAEIRAVLNQFTLDGERATGDVEFIDLASHVFDDRDLAERILDAACFVASRVDVEHLTGLKVTFNPTDVPTNWPDLLGIIDDLVTVAGNPTFRRSFLNHMRLVEDGVTTSDAAPIYVFEGMEFYASGDAEGSSSTELALLANASCTGLREPRAMQAGNPVTTFTNSLDYSAITLEMDHRHRWPVVLRVLAECFGTLGGAGGSESELYVVELGRATEDLVESLKAMAIE